MVVWAMSNSRPAGPGLELVDEREAQVGRISPERPDRVGLDGRVEDAEADTFPVLGPQGARWRRTGAAAAHRQAEPTTPLPSSRPSSSVATGPEPVPSRPRRW